MKKFLVITVLALFIVLPAMATTDWNFTANGNVLISGLTYGDTTSNIYIKNGSKAESVQFSDSGTLIITDAATSTFIIYSTVAVDAIKTASSTITCTTPYTASTEITIASSTADATTITVSLIDLSNALTYNSSCGAATCAEGWQVSGSGATATCAACAVLTGVDTYNSTCGAATCNTGYTLSGSGSSATCIPPAGIIGSSGSSGSSSAAPTTTTTETTAETTTETAAETPAATTETPASTTTKAAEQIKNILAEAATVAGHSVDQILAAVGAIKDAKAETAAETKYTNSLVSGLKNITAEIKTAITAFVNYGTPTTKILGAGERAGVINSYKSAFGKVPSTEAEWSDVIKIGNGRWPTARSATAETQATVEFKKVYKRSPDMKQPNDNAAVTVISYGLRPSDRNLNSEKAAIKTFKAVYGHNPISALAWDIVRSIAYSGATR